MGSKKDVVELAKKVYGSSVLVDIADHLEGFPPAVSIWPENDMLGPLLEIEDEDALLMVEAALRAKRKKQTGGAGRPRKDGS